MDTENMKGTNKINKNKKCISCSKDNSNYKCPQCKLF